MLRGPKQPSAPGKINDHARQTAALIQQRGAAGAGGSMTTKGFLPNRPKPSVPGKAAGELEQFQVQSVHRDHLECKRATWSESLSGWTLGTETVRVAKPEELRMKGWDTVGLGFIGIDGFHYDYEPGGTNPDLSQNPYVERTATMIDGQEYGAADIDFTEEIFPKYIEGRTIICGMKVKQKPIFTVTETVDEVATNYDIEWIDVNIGGRHWLPKYRKIRVCVEGQTGPWFVLIRASDSFQEE